VTTSRPAPIVGDAGGHYACGVTGIWDLGIWDGAGRHLPALGYCGRSAKLGTVSGWRRAGSPDGGVRLASWGKCPGPGTQAVVDKLITRTPTRPTDGPGDVNHDYTGMAHSRGYR
jgi:hypothetical protein